MDSPNWTFGMGYDTDGGPIYDNWLHAFVWETKIYPYAKTSSDLQSEVGCTTCDCPKTLGTCLSICEQQMYIDSSGACEQ